MKSWLLAGLERHRKKALLLGSAAFDATVSASQSTLVADDYDITANSSSTATFTATAKNAAGQAIPGVTVTLAREAIAVSAANSFVTSEPGEIPDDGTTASTITLFLRDASDRPIPNVPAADCVLAVSGAGNTVTQPTGSTDALGRISGSVVSTVAATKTGSYTVRGTLITDTASVVVTGGATPPVWGDIAGYVSWTFGAVGTDTDTLTFDGVLGTPNYDASKLGRAEVFDNTTEFPADIPRYIRFRYNAASGLSLGGTLPGLSNLAIGASNYFRYYKRNLLPDGAAVLGNDHGDQANVGTIQWAFVWGAGTSGSSHFGVTAASPSPFPGSSNTGLGLTIEKLVPWRIEWKITRSDTDSFTFDVRLYDEDISETVPVYEAADFARIGFPATTLDSFTFDFTDLANLSTTMLIGLSGQGGSTYVGDAFDVAALAWGTDDWLGPYRPAEET